MALNKDILGNDLYSNANEYNEKEIENIEQARMDFWKGIAEVIITHFKANGAVKVPALGLFAPNGPVTGSATGQIE